MVREKIAYAMGSIAVAYLAMAMLVGAGPGSDTMARVYPYFQPFLYTFDLQHDWGFFAPDPGTGHVVRYEVRDGRGEVHAFRLTEELHRWDPAYFRFTTLYTNASGDDSYFEAGAITMLCRRHVDAVSIRMVLGHQRAVSPQDYLEGVDTMDDLEIEHREWRSCGGEGE